MRNYSARACARNRGQLIFLGFIIIIAFVAHPDRIDTAMINATKPQLNITTS